jgi:Flp pilus assembly protein CpaB
MNPLARVRHVLARRPWLYWLAVLALAAGAGLVVAHAGASVDAARRNWGVTRDVVVASVDLAPGDPLAGHVEVRSRPGPMVPAAAITDDELGDGARVRQHVGVGEILVAADVAPTGSPQDLIPPGWSAVAVAEPVPSGAQVGDGVAAASGGLVLAPAGVVVGRVGDAVLVAVPDDHAAAVAAASAAGDLTLLLRP